MALLPTIAVDPKGSLSPHAKAQYTGTVYTVAGECLCVMNLMMSPIQDKEPRPHGRSVARIANVRMTEEPLMSCPSRWPSNRGLKYLVEVQYLAIVRSIIR